MSRTRKPLVVTRTRMDRPRWMRPGRLYAYSVVHPITGRTCRWGYVGKSRQSLSNRHGQHMKVQPWGDTVVGKGPREVLYLSWTPEWWLDTLERVLIAVTCPLYNIQGQMPWNLRRITKSAAIAQRLARDTGLRPPRSVALSVRYLLAVLLAAGVIYLERKYLA